MQEHIFGNKPPPTTLLDTMSRLFIVLLFEPIRISIDIEFSKPVTMDTELLIRNATNSISAASTDDLLQYDSLLQTHLANFTVNWFEDVLELGVPYRCLSRRVLDACRVATVNWRDMFNVDRCEVNDMRIKLTGFRYNARIAKKLNRGQLLAAFCRAVIQMQQPNHAAFTRDVCVASIDNTLSQAWAMAATPTGATFCTQTDAHAHCSYARNVLKTMKFQILDVDEYQIDPHTEYQNILNSLQPKY
jgi:hypothetical protein